MSDGVDSALDARAAALESASATLADAREQELADRLRSLLAHPASWVDLPGAATPPRPADRPDESATPPRPAGPTVVTAAPPTVPAAAGTVEPVGPGHPAETGEPIRLGDPVGSGPAALADTDLRPAEAGAPAQTGESAQTGVPAQTGESAEAGEPVERGGGRPAQPVSLPDRSRRRPRRPRAWAAAIGGLAAAAALVLFVLVPAVVPDRETVRVQLAGAGPAGGATASATAVRLAAGWHITLQVDGLPGAPADTYYEGWVRRGDTYVPLGTFHLRQPGKVELWAGVTMTEYTSIVITRQRVGAGFGPAETVLVGDIRR